MKKILYVILLTMLTVNSLSAQISGNPVNSSGVKEWTISASGTYFHQGIGTEIATAKRLLVKSSWGVTPWFDLYILGGAANLELRKRAVTSISDYKDKYRFAYGMGFNAAIGNKLQLWFGGNALRHKSEGNFTEPLEIGSQTYTRRFQMEYDWREFKSFLGVIYKYNQFSFYAAGAGWYLWRLDDKEEFLDSANSSSYQGRATGEFLSGFYTGAIVGIEMNLPDNYAITIEALLFNQSNLQFMVGISQTGYQSSKLEKQNRK